MFTASTLYHVCCDRENLPDLGRFTRFEFPSIGRIYDTNGQPLIELAREYRHITPYADIPPIVRDAILATEDKRFFSHDGVDYFSLPRMIDKVRVGAWGTRLATGGHPVVDHRAVGEKPHRGCRWPLAQSTAPVSQGVSAGSAQPCTRRWRFPCRGLRPRLPCGCGPGG